MGAEIIISIISSALAVLSLVLSIVTFYVSNKRDAYMTIDSLYDTLLQEGLRNPRLRDPVETVKYDTYQDDLENRDFYLSYCTYANMIWNFIETVYDLHKKSNKNSQMIKTWIPVIIEENKLHYRWFKNNKRLYKQEFQDYVIKVINEIEVAKGDIDDLDRIYSYMEKEFPKEVLKNKEQLLNLIESGKYSFYLFSLKQDSDKKDYVGYAFGCLNDDKTLFFLDYINILPAYQSCGYGSTCLKLLRDYVLDSYNGKAVVFEIEKPDGNENSQSNRRFNFYHRLGSVKLDVPYLLPSVDGGVEMDLMILTKDGINKINKEEIKALVKNSISLIHSDIKCTQKIIASYIDKIPDFER